jgi:hypothetical protein
MVIDQRIMSTRHISVLKTRCCANYMLAFRAPLSQKMTTRLTKIHPMKISLWSILFLALCGCVSTVHDLAPASLAPLKPGLARIEIHRESAIVGAATRDFILDVGPGGERNGTMLQFPRLVKTPQLLFRRQPQDAEPIENLLQVKRETKRGEGTVIHYLVGAHDIGIDRGLNFNEPVVRIGSPEEETREGRLRRESLPLNVSVIGKVGGAGTLVWDRPPGMVQLEVVSLVMGGLLIHPENGDFRVEAGKVYRVIYSRSLKLKLTEVP